MSFKIKTMNKISEEGLKLFGEGFDISEDCVNPEAIVVRSAKVDTDEFSSLLAVARAGAGTNNVTKDKATQKGVCVFNTPGANANAVAELVFVGLGLALRNVISAAFYSETLKNITDDEEITKLVEKNKSKFAGTEIAGKTMGVIGLGKIGVLVANGALGRGMKVLAYEPYPNVENMHALGAGVIVTQNLNEVISAADAISVNVPLLDSTTGMISKESMKSFKDGGVVLNFARGGIVDNEEIIDMLDSGKVSTYVTDFPTAKQINNSKCICLPHLGASTAEAEENCATMAVSQMKDYLKYGVVINSVNFPAIVGYPAASIKNRIIVINLDVPNMISVITKIFGSAGLNISSFKNESNGKVGYNIIDIESDVDSELVSSIEAIENVVRVRVIAL